MGKSKIIKGSKKELYFVNLSKPNMGISAGVRDWILPYKFLFLEPLENGDFLIIPTTSEQGYKLSITGGHSQISCVALLNAMPVKEKVRIRCEKLSDGSVLCKASEFR